MTGMRIFVLALAALLSVAAAQDDPEDDALLACTKYDFFSCMLTEQDNDELNDCLSKKMHKTIPPLVNGGACDSSDAQCSDEACQAACKTKMSDDTAQCLTVCTDHLDWFQCDIAATVCPQLSCDQSKKTSVEHVKAKVISKHAKVRASTMTTNIQPMIAPIAAALFGAMAGALVTMLALRVRSHASQNAYISLEA